MRPVEILRGGWNGKFRRPHIVSLPPSPHIFLFLTPHISPPPTSPHLILFLGSSLWHIFFKVPDSMFYGTWWDLIWDPTFIHSSPEVHIVFIQFSQWAQVTDPDPGSCRVCQMVFGWICKRPRSKIPYGSLALLRFLSTCHLRKITKQLKSHTDQCKCASLILTQVRKPRRLTFLHRNQVRRIGFEMNSNPVSRTQFLWKKVSLRGFRTQGLLQVTLTTIWQN